jgi:hypothetical protein
MTNQWTKRWLAAFVTAVGLLRAGQARADFLIELSMTSPPTFNSTTGQWTYTYNATLLTGSELDRNGGGTTVTNPANFFTLYAIPGYVPGSVTESAMLASNFGVEESTMGRNAPTQASHSVAGMLDLSFVYTGATEISGEAALGSFSFNSTGAPAPAANLFYVGATQKDTPGVPGDEEIANNTSLVAGPSLTVITMQEPAAISLAWSTTPALLLCYWLHRRKVRASVA